MSFWRELNGTVVPNLPPELKEIKDALVPKPFEAGDFVKAVKWLHVWIQLEPVVNEPRELSTLQNGPFGQSGVLKV